MILFMENRMKITNNADLPKPLYDRIVKDVKGEAYPDLPKDVKYFFRVTELLSPPLIRTLRNKYRDSDEWVVDAEE